MKAVNRALKGKNIHLEEFQMALILNQVFSSLLNYHANHAAYELANPTNKNGLGFQERPRLPWIPQTLLFTSPWPPRPSSDT